MRLRQTLAKIDIMPLQQLVSANLVLGDVQGQRELFGVTKIAAQGDLLTLLLQPNPSDSAPSKLLSQRGHPLGEGRFWRYPLEGLGMLYGVVNPRLGLLDNCFHFRSWRR